DQPRVQQCTVHEGQLSGGVDVRTGAHRRDVGGHRRRHVRKGDPEVGQPLRDGHAFARLKYATRFSGVGPGTTWTSSQPSAPKLSKIALVLWISSGAVRYSHVVMPSTLGHHRSARTGYGTRRSA